ncbi:hypothetical protein QR680_000275 [Steinernema hermaphroditum]|uniref:F-box domain-containing protein n=1 Tax=Steinernema hermaphroditum TaxID=289476 RepID=A0AA39LE07_9BILA|nr:hypothetical protein QR680_000275 [Steinernema hermaphroditum]
MGKTKEHPNQDEHEPRVKRDIKKKRKHHSATCVKYKKHEASFSDLPENVKYKIFQYFSMRRRVQVEVVCRDWYDIIQTTFKGVSEIHIPTTIADHTRMSAVADMHVCGFLKKYGQYLRKIEFDIPSATYGHHIFHCMSKRCPDIQELHLSSDIEGKAYGEVLRIYTLYAEDLIKNLQSFQLTHTIGNFAIPTQSLRALIRLLKNVHTFKLDMPVFPEDVTVLFPQSPSLKRFGISMLQNKVDRHRRVCLPVRYVHKFFHFLVDFKDNLESIEVNLCYDNSLNEIYMHDMLGQLAVKNPNLRKLTLSLRTADMDPEQIWFGHHALKKLGDFTKLEELSLVATYLPCDFHKFLSPTITSLALTAIQNINHALVIDIIKALPNLRQFHLSYGQWDLNVEHIRAPTIIEVMKINPVLKELEFSPCEGLEIMEIMRFLKDKVHNILSRSYNLIMVAPKQIRMKFMNFGEDFRADLGEDIKKFIGCSSMFTECQDDNLTLIVNRECSECRAA